MRFLILFLPIFMANIWASGGTEAVGDPHERALFRGLRATVDSEGARAALRALGGPICCASEEEEEGIGGNPAEPENWWAVEPTHPEPLPMFVDEDAAQAAVDGLNINTVEPEADRELLELVNSSYLLSALRILANREAIPRPGIRVVKAQEVRLCHVECRRIGPLTVIRDGDALMMRGTAFLERLIRARTPYGRVAVSHAALQLRTHGNAAVGAYEVLEFINNLLAYHRAPEPTREAVRRHFSEADAARVIGMYDYYAARAGPCFTQLPPPPAAVSAVGAGGAEAAEETDYDSASTGSAVSGGAERGSPVPNEEGGSGGGAAPGPLAASAVTTEEAEALSSDGEEDDEEGEAQRRRAASVAEALATPMLPPGVSVVAAGQGGFAGFGPPSGMRFVFARHGDLELPPILDPGGAVRDTEDGALPLSPEPVGAEH